MSQLPDEPLTLTVHSLPHANAASLDAATRTGRWKMLILLLVCAAPVIASYFTYYVVRPQGKGGNYGELIEPQRPLPAFNGTDSQGRSVPLTSLRDQWLFISVADSACDTRCEKHLYLQHQLRETLGKEKGRLDWVWLRTGETPPSASLQAATASATVLQVDPQALAGWLAPANGRALADHLYLVDPLGNWMMRFPPDADPKQVKRDLDRLMRAAAFWDRDGRPDPKAAP
jgi:hypothetical protein